MNRYQYDYQRNHSSATQIFSQGANTYHILLLFHS